MCALHLLSGAGEGNRVGEEVEAKEVPVTVGRMRGRRLGWLPLAGSNRLLYFKVLKFIYHDYD